MPDLKCQAGDCIYNVHGLCAKLVINVGTTDALSSSETSCLSFTARANIKREDFRAEFASFIEPKLKTQINCLSVNCRYNNNFLCSAKRVLVSGEFAEEVIETNCETFKL